MKRLLIFCVLTILLSCEKDDEGFTDDCPVLDNTIGYKINGGSLLQTWILTEEGSTTDLAQKTNANWVSLSPIIGIRDISAQELSYKYRFPVSEEVYKMRTIIPNMLLSGIHSIMLKPITQFGAVMIDNYSGFWGDFYVDTEEEWLEVERAYAELFYEFAKLSEEFPEVELLSIGNELKQFTNRRPEFFKDLIAQIRTDFPNLKLTYASNWDEYDSVSFWGNLDYIGVNSYFPLVNEKTPTVDQITQAWEPIKNNLSTLSCEYNRPILFTEYGYRSIDYAAWEAWQLDNIATDDYNFEAQNNGYAAFYNTFWNENWVAGGFFWEWKVLLDREVNDPYGSGWYVNDKPVENIIKEWYTD